MTEVTSRLLKSYGGQIERVTHNHNGTVHDLAEKVTGHEPITTYDTYWQHLDNPTVEAKADV